ncbi:VOC family protein [Candidatus Litorirhabdus singularis]|nr:VOC family protein [Candidatus Litorirhabdus singularis]
MPSEAVSEAVRLFPQQVCFVVADVAAAVAYAESLLGWGPFHTFQADVAEASYREWRGRKVTDVALGMAGSVQVEFLHVHQGHDTTADYQAQYGSGFQHIGTYCEDLAGATARMNNLGASINEENEYPGIKFAFVNAPTGPGMFELLQPTQALQENKGISDSAQAVAAQEPKPAIDRATIVTADMDTALAFYTAAFRWTETEAQEDTLLWGDKRHPVLRHIARAGKLELELIQPLSDSANPYTEHLVRGDHGLVHAGGPADFSPPGEPAGEGSWEKNDEHFAFHDWPGGPRSLQIRQSP